jgi:hypothetical protein
MLESAPGSGTVVELGADIDTKGVGILVVLYGITGSSVG